MNEKFQSAVASLHPKYEQLVSAASFRPRTKLPQKGVYSFSERGRLIYVGRSDNIPNRRAAHLSGSTNKAALSRLIACKELGIVRDYAAGRDKFKKHPKWANAFAAARARVREMEFRAVEEADPICQALLEVYSAVAGNAEHNDFGNH